MPLPQAGRGFCISNEVKLDDLLVWNRSQTKLSLQTGQVLRQPYYLNTKKMSLFVGCIFRRQAWHKFLNLLNALSIVSNTLLNYYIIYILGSDICLQSTLLGRFYLCISTHFYAARYSGIIVLITPVLEVWGSTIHWSQNHKH